MFRLTSFAILTCLCILLSACKTVEIGVEHTPTAPATGKPLRAITATPLATSASPSPAILTTGWLTYTNTKYGFSFNYPPTFSIWKGPASDSPDEVFHTTNAIYYEGRLISTDETTALTFGILTPEAVDPSIRCTDDRDCLTQYTSSRAEPIHATLKTTVLGRPIEGVEYYSTNPLYAVVEWNFVFEDQGRPWRAYAYINLKSGETTDPYNRLPVFEQILATLKLFNSSAGQ